MHLFGDRIHFIESVKTVNIAFHTNLLNSREDEYLVNMQHTVIPSWYQREGYIKAMANLIEKELQKFDSPEEVNPHIEHFACSVVLLHVQVMYMTEGDTAKIRSRWFM